MMQSFVLPANGKATPESIERRRRLAEAMLQSGSNAGPVGHWTQGAARMVQALMGGLAMNRAEKQETEGRKGANEALVRALSGDANVAPSQQDPNGALMGAINDPWQSPQGTAMAMDMWKRQNTPVDPMDAQMKQLELQKLQAEIAKMQNPQANTEYGLNPQFGVDANGNPVMIQVGKNGQAVQTQMPPDVQLSKAPIKLDAGTHFILLDPITRQPAGQIPKDLAGAEYQKEVGTAQGKAAAAASSDIAAADMALDLLDSIETDPNLAWGVGGTSMLNVIPGTPGRDFQTKVDQATSGAFLSAIQQMRGLGALSNAEGQTATQAVTRMNTSTSEEAFRSALADYRRIVELGRDRAAGRIDAPGREQPQTPQSGGGWITLPNGVKIKQVQ